MRNRRILFIVLAALLALMMIVPILVTIVSSAGGVSQSEIDALREKAAALEEKQAQVSNQLKSVQYEQASVLSKKQTLDSQIELTQQEIENLSQQIATYGRLIDEKQIELEDAAQKEAAQFAMFKTRMRAMEENGDISYVAVLFQARSFSDLLSRIDFVSEIMDYDRDLTDKLQRAKDAVAEAKRALEESKAGCEEAKQAQTEKQADLERQVGEANQLLATLNTDIQKYNQYSAELDSQQEALDSQISDLEAQLKKQQEAEAARGGTVYVGTGTFIWPCPSSYNITSDFGVRPHPIYGIYKMHYGVDIGASYGAKILAADSGTVIMAQYYGGYGNLVIISHGNGNSTRYGHMSGYNCSVGDKVEQGQVVGYVGATGDATGNHLHFEIRISGEAVNPMNYFS